MFGKQKGKTLEKGKLSYHLFDHKQQSHQQIIIALNTPSGHRIGYDSSHDWYDWYVTFRTCLQIVFEPTQWSNNDRSAVTHSSNPHLFIK
jgi:hypothetical protein